MTQLTHDSAEKKLSDMGMGDMPVTEYRPVNPCVCADWFLQYKKLCREFIKTLTDSVDQLAMLNLTQDEFLALIMGRAIPPNMSFRFRIPLTLGGTLDTNNIFMCRTFPHSHQLDIFLINQYGADTIWLPNPTSKVYVPSYNTSGGDGGNATSDRLSQIAAQIIASRGME